MGNSYTMPPIIGFSSAPAGGTTAVGVASITNDFVNCDGLFGGKVAAILLTNAGSGYTEAPTVTIQGGGGAGAPPADGGAACALASSADGAAACALASSTVGTVNPVPHPGHLASLPT